MPADRYGMDPEQMRRVIVSIGKPRPSAMVWPTLPRRTVMLVVLLALVILLGLGSLASAEGNVEPVQKGSARARGTWISPLEKLKLEVPAAPPSLKNFLDNFAGPRPTAMIAAPGPTLVLRPYEPRESDPLGRPGEPAAAIGFLALFCLIVLWLHLRARRYERMHEEARKKGARR